MALRPSALALVGRPRVQATRQVLATGVLVWSFATALVPMLAGFMPGLVFSRILVGIGEGVSPSAATDLIARHVTNPLVRIKFFSYSTLFFFRCIFKAKAFPDSGCIFMLIPP
ncbi:hypothetical protein Dimus_002432 [Dionaea muscipula]